MFQTTFFLANVNFATQPRSSNALADFFFSVDGLGGEKENGVKEIPTRSSAGGFFL
jgi:hypothetical protein